MGCRRRPGRLSGFHSREDPMPGSLQSSNVELVLADICVEEMDPVVLEVLQMQRSKVEESKIQRQPSLALVDSAYHSASVDTAMKDKAIDSTAVLSHLQKAKEDSHCNHPATTHDPAAMPSTSTALTSKPQRINQSIPATRHSKPQASKVSLITKHSDRTAKAHSQSNVSKKECHTAVANRSGQRKQSGKEQICSPKQESKQSKPSPWSKPPPIPKVKKNKYPELPPTECASSSSGGWTRSPPIYEICLTKPEVNWSCRQPLRMSLTVNQISDWIGRVELELRFVEREIPMAEYRRYMHTPDDARDMLAFDQEYWTRSIAPEYWEVDRIGHQTPSMYWEEMKSSKLAPVDDTDLEDVAFWWVQYPPYGAPLCQCYPQPLLNGIDPSETHAERAARELDGGSNGKIKPYFEEKRRRERIERRKKRDGLDDVVW